jgi:hypothetical protein
MQIEMLTSVGPITDSQYHPSKARAREELKWLFAERKKGVLSSNQILFSIYINMTHIWPGWTHSLFRKKFFKVPK